MFVRTPLTLGQALWTYARVSPELLRAPLLARAGEVFTRLLSVQPHFFDPVAAAALAEQGRLMGELLNLSAFCTPLRALLHTECRALTSLDLTASAHVTPQALTMLSKDTSTLTRLALLTCSHDRIADEGLIAEFARSNPALRGIGTPVTKGLCVVRCVALCYVVCVLCVLFCLVYCVC